MKSIQSIIFALLATVLFSSCTKWDDFKKYVEEGEILYTSKMDSVKIFSGKERVMLTGLLKSDPKLDRVAIYWDNGGDSVIYNYTKQNPGVDSFSRTFPVKEGVKSFKVITYDADNNKSVNVFAVGTSYGTNFRKRMSDRPITSVSYSAAGTTINWDQMDLNAGPQYTEIEYTVGSETKTIITPISAASTVIAAVSVVPPLKFRTIFKPDVTCIDTFSTGFSLHNVIADVTGLYLSNVGPGFQRATFDGRWGTLAAPWVTNAGAKNKGGVQGGYTSDSRWNVSGQICWETWGNTPVNDGKIYQATASPLPAGSYTVRFQYYSEIQSNSTVHCIAAAGTGIPSLPNLSSALGYTALYNSIPVGSTGPSLDEIRSFTFTVDSPKVVSIGFLGNIVGSGNPGTYFVVRNISLIKN